MTVAVLFFSLPVPVPALLRGFQPPPDDAFEDSTPNILISIISTSVAKVSRNFQLYHHVA